MSGSVTPREEPDDTAGSSWPQYGGDGVRVGDAERDRAVDRLREHVIAGRLDQDEFDERMAAALSARTDRQLAALFTDLPAGTDLVDPVNDTGPTPAPRSTEVEATGEPSQRMVRFYGAASSVAFPLALIACFVTGWRYWWIILIPMILMPAIGQALGIHSADDEEDDQDDERPRRGD